MRGHVVGADQNSGMAGERLCPGFADDLRARWVGAHLVEVETPALMIDRPTLEKNILRMSDLIAPTGARLRPHAKAHRCSRIARLQLAAGAVGIACSTPSEAAALVGNGIDDVLISTVVGSLGKADRLAALAEGTHITAVIDSIEGLTMLQRAARARSVTIPTLVDVNVGQDRTGVSAAHEVVALAQRLDRATGLAFAGLQGFDGQTQRITDPGERAVATRRALGRLAEAHAALEAAGIAVAAVTAAGTGTAAIVAGNGLVTEVQPGGYVLMDHSRLAVQPCEFAIAATILATVIGRYADYLVVDVGSKSVATDKGQPIVCGRREATFRTAGDEHGVVSGDVADLRVGDVIQLVSGHVDATINLYSVMFIVADDQIEDIWPIEARGCSW